MTSGRVELARRMGAPEESTKRMISPSSDLSRKDAPHMEEVGKNELPSVKVAPSSNFRSKKLFIMMYLFVLVSGSWLQEPKELEKYPFSSQKYFFLSIQTTFFDTFMHYCIIWRMNSNESTKKLLVRSPNNTLSASILLLS